MKEKKYQEDLEDFIDKVESEVEDESEDTSSYEIFTYGADYTLSVLYEKMKNEEIITPNFQRRYVWNNKQASRLVESFLLGLPVPGIFLSKEKKTGNLVVIDGQQRLVTCKSFRDEIFPLTNDPFLLKDVKAKWNGKKYSELDLPDRKRFDDSVLRATIITQVHPEDNTSIYHIFQRLNTGGTILQNQEIRNSLYYGKLNDLIRQLNKHKLWRELYGSSLPHKRMKDEELILRFFAIYFNFDQYKKPMNEFLSNFMAQNRDCSNAELASMKKLFIDTISFMHKEAGAKSFRPRGNINAAAFDSIMYTVAKNKSKLKANLKHNIIENLFKDPAFIKSITLATTDEESVKSRMTLAKKYLVTH